jgi:predicted metal-binding protein
MEMPSKLPVNKHKRLEELFQDHGYTNYTWINPKKIIVSQWVRMKCMFGCGEYGNAACCPPNVPSVAECVKFFSEYNDAVIFHFRKKVDQPENRHQWSKKVNLKLSKLERKVFLSGYEKTFLLFMDSCSVCANCAAKKEGCKNPKIARPAPEALAVDVYSTVRQFGLPVQVLKDYSEEMNRYAFMLIQ